MNKEILNLMIMHGVEFEKELTLEEIKQIEKNYGIKFPDSLKDFLMMALPISKGFYNWRNTDNDNVELIKQVMKKPMTDIDEMAEEIYWCDNWGEEPEDNKSIGKEVRERIKKAPKLLPVYMHRYMPIVLDDNPPVISVHGTDIIYYGKDLEDYLKIEFGEKKQNTIVFKDITPIPFWTDIM